MECPECGNRMFENEDLDIESILSWDCIDVRLTCPECYEEFYVEFKC